MRETKKHKMKTILNSFSAEWLKSRRTASSWLVIIGGFFIPFIVFLMSWHDRAKLPGFYTSDKFWEVTFNTNWQTMAVFLLPMGVILCTSLITQLEYRNNAWKLVHTLPQAYSVTFFTKLMGIMVMMMQFFVLFNIGIYLGALLPAVVFKEVPFPSAIYPLFNFIRVNAFYYLDCLPIIALQYLVSLRFRNFMAPLGIGLGLVVACTFAVSWKYGYIVPYTYTLLYFMSRGDSVPLAVNIHLLAIVYFIVITAVSYVMFRTRKEIG